MGGCVQVCIAASNELASTNPHEMVRAETAISTVTLLRSSCGNNTQLWDSRCKSVHLAADVMSSTLRMLKSCDCDMLYRAWEGALRPQFKRATSLAFAYSH